MKNFEGIGNISLTQKICLAGLFTALATILQKVLAINYLAGFPFFRISFGAPAIIVFSSIFLGPFWGAAVGLFSDILGYFAFDASSFGYMPLISLTYLVLGFSAFFVYKLIDQIKNEKLIFIVEIVFLLGALLGLSLYLIIGTGFPLIEKILIPVGAFILISLLVIFQILTNREGSKFHAPIKLSFTYFLLDLFVMVLFGSLMKTLSFTGIPYSTIVTTQSLVMIFNVVFNTILLAIFFRLTKKYVR